MQLFAVCGRAGPGKMPAHSPERAPPLAPEGNHPRRLPRLRGVGKGHGKTGGLALQQVS